MKRLLVLIGAASALLGQTPPGAPAAPPATPTAPVAAQTSPVPQDQEVLSGSIDLGYRWVGVGGSFNTYRTVVNYGSGPKLLGADFTVLGTFLKPGQRFFDRVDVRAYDWGDDPYSTLHVNARKQRIYDFNADYRNLAFYTNLPAFADPLLATNGVILNEQAIDSRKHIADLRLDLFPDHRIMPFLEYQHNADNGTGIATFVANANKYPVMNLIRNSNENYLGGVRIELPRLHIKLEQGGTTFKDDQQLNSVPGQINFGNFFAPVFGQTLFLSSLYEAYGVRGHSVYTDASFSANPTGWADLYGTFLYSEPVSDVKFVARDTGNQVLLSQLLFYTGEQSLISSFSKLPHTTANLGAEIRPMARLRLIPVWLTDRLHSSGSSAVQQTLLTAAGAVPIPGTLNSRLVANSNQVEMNVYFDVSRKLTVRGGYRYVWGDASDVILPPGGLTGFEQGKIRRNVVIAGVSWHPVMNAWVNVDFEDGISGSTYFRTSLFNYQKARVRGRHQISPSFNASASFSVLNNQNPSPGVHYDFLALQESVSLLYSPGGKKWSFEGSYTRASLRSDINYLEPETLTPMRSLYRVNSHTVTALFDVAVPEWGGNRARLSFGGSAFLSSGSNPTTFYQPTAKLAVPVWKNVSWVSEWRYYGFAETFYAFQGFRSDMVTTGVRITR